MSVKYPVNKEEMMSISGVGELKYSKYGESFEEAIKNYALEHNYIPMEIWYWDYDNIEEILIRELDLF